MTTTITALFKTPTAAGAAVNALMAMGVPQSRVSVLASDTVGKSAFGVEKHSKAAEGVAIGAGVGGGIAALVAGLTAVGAIATSGVGLLAAGPIVAALAGAGAGAAAGGTVGGLIGLAIPEHEVKHYEDAIAKGAVLVAIETDGTPSEKDIRKELERHGGESIANA